MGEGKTISGQIKSHAGKYRSGRRLEYEVRDFLKEQGYGFVVRSAASKTPVDIVAFAQHEVLFVQCKRHGVLGSQEWNTFFELAQRYNAIAVLAHKDARKLRLFRIIGLRKPRSHGKPMEEIFNET